MKDIIQNRKMINAKRQPDNLKRILTKATFGDEKNVGNQCASYAQILLKVNHLPLKVITRDVFQMQI
jgi:hypothetical protein